MTTQAHTPAGVDPRSTELGAGAGGDVGLVYDTLGMPLSLSAARAMTRDHIEAALVRTFAQLRHESPVALIPSDLIDSIEVVFLINRYFKGVGRKAFDLGKVDRSRWSTLEGVADVLHAEVAVLS